MKTQWHGIGNSVLPQIPQIFSRLFDLLQEYCCLQHVLGGFGVA